MEAVLGIWVSIFISLFKFLDSTVIIIVGAQQVCVCGTYLKTNAWTVRIIWRDLTQRRTEALRRADAWGDLWKWENERRWGEREKGHSIPRKAGTGPAAEGAERVRGTMGAPEPRVERIWVSWVRHSRQPGARPTDLPRPWEALPSFWGQWEEIGGFWEGELTNDLKCGKIILAAMALKDLHFCIVVRDGVMESLSVKTINKADF